MKRFVIGLVVGLCIALPVNAIADSLIGAKIETTVKVNLDGEYLPVEAIGLRGTTYAPVRAFAESLGKEVAWMNGEVVITTPNSSNDEVMSTRNGKQSGANDEYINSLEAAITVKKNTLATLKYLLEVDIENGVEESIIQRQRDDIANLEKIIEDLEQKISELQATE